MQWHRSMPPSLTLASLSGACNSPGAPDRVALREHKTKSLNLKMPWVRSVLGWEPLHRPHPTTRWGDGPIVILARLSTGKTAI